MNVRTMNASKLRLSLVSILMVACLLIHPAEIQGQCATTGTPNMTTFTTGTDTIVITKYLTTTRMCTGSISMALACYPALAEVKTLTFLVASALTASMGVECGWNCGTCTVTTNAANDGLPVELMDFGFEGE